MGIDKNENAVGWLLMKNICLSQARHDYIKKQIANFLSKRKQLSIRRIAENFGLKFNFSYKIIIVSAEEKYLFNYFSGAFENKNLKEGAVNFHKFLKNKRFLKAIKSLSGRAIYHKGVVKKVFISLDYLDKINFNYKFISKMRLLANKIDKELKSGKGVILIGFPMNGEVEYSERLLAHEVYHLLLMKHNIWFQGINSKLDYLDEELAELLARSYMCTEETLKGKYWYNLLINLRKKDRVKKIKEVFRLKQKKEKL